MVYYGQVVIGPPGSGKSTYCHGIQQYYPPDKLCMINLDPANDQVNYECQVDVRDLVRVEQIMQQHKLGPNGALLWAMEELERRLDWLLIKLKPFQGKIL